MQEGTQLAKEVVFIDVEKIVPSPHQTREIFDEEGIAELGQSIIENNGLAQPVVVRLIDETEGIYALIAGERRWRAHKVIGWDKIESIVKNVSEEEAENLTLVENIQRQDLTIMEKARHVQKLASRHNGDLAIVAQKLGKSVAFVSEYLSLFSLPVEVQKLIDFGKINLSQAKVLSEVIDDKQKILGAELAVKLNLNADRLRARVQRHIKPPIDRTGNISSVGVKYGTYSGAIVNLYEMAENFDYDILRDNQKRKTLRNQIDLLMEELGKAKQKLA